MIFVRQGLGIPGLRHIGCHVRAAGAAFQTDGQHVGNRDRWLKLSRTQWLACV
jgi:hypothetical protein